MFSCIIHMQEEDRPTRGKCAPLFLFSHMFTCRKKTDQQEENVHRSSCSVTCSHAGRRQTNKRKMCTALLVQSHVQHAGRRQTNKRKMCTALLVQSHVHMQEEDRPTRGKCAPLFLFSHMFTCRKKTDQQEENVHRSSCSVTCSHAGRRQTNKRKMCTALLVQSHVHMQEDCKHTRGEKVDRKDMKDESRRQLSKNRCVVNHLQKVLW